MFGNIKTTMESLNGILDSTSMVGVAYNLIKKGPNVRIIH